MHNVFNNNIFCKSVSNVYKHDTRNLQYLLAKHNAAVTPMNPKNGADVGQVS